MAPTHGVSSKKSNVTGQSNVTARPVFKLHVGHEQSSLASNGSSDAALLVEIALGLQTLLREVLRHAPPTPAELETAIALISQSFGAPGLRVSQLLLQRTNARRFSTHAKEGTFLFSPLLQHFA